MMNNDDTGHNLKVIFPGFNTIFKLRKINTIKI